LPQAVSSRPSKASAWVPMAFSTAVG
jgi:hypothetical protein